MNSLPINQWDIHVLVPCAAVKDVDASSIHEYHQQNLSLPITSEEREIAVLTEWTPTLIKNLEDHILSLGVKSVRSHHCCFKNYRDIIAEIPPKHNSHTIVLNLMDGHESDGWAGITVLEELESKNIRFTGSASSFYRLDTIKSDMKEALVKYCPELTPRYFNLTSRSLEKDKTISEMKQCMTFPVIVKPSPSSGSQGMNENSVCYSAEDAYKQAILIREEFGGAYAEEFIAGREFTALVTGCKKHGIKTYSAVERVFSSSVPTDSQFLSWDMKWQQWGADENSGKSWWYAPAPEVDQPNIQKLVREVFEKADGNGYARMDLRMDSNKRIYVVDVNSNCSVDVDPESAMGLILKIEGKSVADLLRIIFEDAIKSHDLHQ